MNTISMPPQYNSKPELEAKIERLKAELRTLEVALAMKDLTPSETPVAKSTVVNPTPELAAIFEERYKLSIAFHQLRRDKGDLCSAFSRDWVKEQYLPLLTIPKHTHMTTLRGHEGMVLCLTAHDGKVYSGGIGENILVWSCTDCSLITTLEGHEGIVWELIIHDGKLYSFSGGDHTIKVWNCSTDALITTLEGHNGAVGCFIINDGKLYYGSEDDTIKVWNCSNHSLIATLRGHTSIIVALAIHDGKLYSSGRENLGDENNEEQDPIADTPSIKVWNCSNHKLITTLRGYTDHVYSLTAHDGKLYSGSVDSTIKIWNCSTNKLIKTLTDHADLVLYLIVQYGKLYSVSHDGTIKVWNCSDHELIANLEGYAQYSLIFHDHKLYYGAKDSDGQFVVKVVNCINHELVTTLQGHTDRAMCFTVQDGKLYSGSQDHTISVL